MKKEVEKKRIKGAGKKQKKKRESKDKKKKEKKKKDDNTFVALNKFDAADTMQPVNSNDDVEDHIEEPIDDPIPEDPFIAPRKRNVTAADIDQLQSLPQKKKRFNCECGMATNDKYSLRRHKRRQHGFFCTPTWLQCCRAPCLPEM